jgi:adenosylcobinamide-phosphate synthase
MPGLLLPPPLGEGWGGGTGPSIHAAALVIALWIDHALGEPPARWHPVVWMGRYLGAIGRWIAPRIDTTPSARSGPFAAAPSARSGPFAAGTLAWCVGGAAVLLAAAALSAVAAHLPPWAAALLLGLALKPLLAWRMLRDEVLAVEAALARSLAEGRTRLTQLVSRDVATLDEAADSQGRGAQDCRGQPPPQPSPRGGKCDTRCLPRSELG